MLFRSEVSIGGFFRRSSLKIHDIVANTRFLLHYERLVAAKFQTEIYCKKEPGLLFLLTFPVNTFTMIICAFGRKHTIEFTGKAVNLLTLAAVGIFLGIQAILAGCVFWRVSHLVVRGDPGGVAGQELRLEGIRERGVGLLVASLLAAVHMFTCTLQCTRSCD